MCSYVMKQGDWFLMLTTFPSQKILWKLGVLQDLNSEHQNNSVFTFSSTEQTLKMCVISCIIPLASAVMPGGLVADTHIHWRPN